MTALRHFLKAALTVYDAFFHLNPPDLIGSLADISRNTAAGCPTRLLSVGMRLAGVTTLPRPHPMSFTISRAPYDKSHFLTALS